MLMKNTPKMRFLYYALAGFLAISLSIAFFFVLYRCEGLGEAIGKVNEILAPFIYGSVVAYLLRPLCNTYDRFLAGKLPGKLKKVANPLAVALAMISGLLIVYALIIMIAPQLSESIKTIWTTLPEKINQLIEWLTKIFGENEEMLAYFEAAYSAVYTELDAWAKGTLVPSITNVVSGVGMSVWKVLMFFYNLLIGIIVAVYLLGSRKKFRDQSVLLVRSAFKPKWADFILEEVAFIDKMFGGFIDGKILDSAIMGVLCYIGCVVFQFPNALLVSAIVGITNVIPFFGPFIGAIPSVLLILIESPIKAVWFALFVFALQQLDGNVIGPAILGDRTGLSSFWVLFAIILFGGIWGLVGMVICVPLFAVIYDTVKRLVRKGLEKNGLPEVWQQYKADHPDEEPRKKRTWKLKKKK